jgi:hypothetical protein
MSFAVVYSSLELCNYVSQDCICFSAQPVLSLNGGEIVPNTNSSYAFSNYHPNSQLVLYKSNLVTVLILDRYRSWRVTPVLDYLQPRSTTKSSPWDRTHIREVTRLEVIESNLSTTEAVSIADSIFYKLLHVCFLLFFL